MNSSGDVCWCRMDGDFLLVLERAPEALFVIQCALFGVSTTEPSAQPTRLDFSGPQSFSPAADSEEFISFALIFAAAALSAAAVGDQLQASAASPHCHLLF